MHSGLSNVDYMITPADLRRTLAKLADNHAQNQAAPVITPLDLAKMHRKSLASKTVVKNKMLLIFRCFLRMTALRKTQDRRKIIFKKHLLSQAYLQHLCHHADRQILLQLLLL